MISLGGRSTGFAMFAQVAQTAASTAQPVSTQLPAHSEEMAAATPQFSVNAPGIARLAFERAGHTGRTAISTAFATSPLRILMPRNHGHAAWVFLASLGGGLVDRRPSRRRCRGRARGLRLPGNASIDEGLPLAPRLLAAPDRARGRGRVPRAHARSGRLLRGSALRATDRPDARRRRVRPGPRRLYVRAERSRRAMGVLSLRVSDDDQARRCPRADRRDPASTPVTAPSPGGWDASTFSCRSSRSVHASRPFAPRCSLAGRRASPTAP